MDSNFTATHPTIDESRLHPGFDETELVGSENNHQNDERSSEAEQSTQSTQRSQATDERKPSSNSTENKELFTKKYTLLEKSTAEFSLVRVRSDQKRHKRKSNNNYPVWVYWLRVLFYFGWIASFCSMIYSLIMYLNEK